VSCIVCGISIKLNFTSSVEHHHSVSESHHIPSHYKSLMLTSRSKEWFYEYDGTLTFHNLSTGDELRKAFFAVDH